MKRALLIAVSSGVILLISFSVSLYFFLKSSSFPGLVEKAINNRTEKHVEIDSISFVKGPGIIIGGVIVREKFKGKPFIEISSAKIDFSIEDILNSSIERIDIKGAKLFLDLKKRKVPDTGRPSLPFTFQDIHISDGEVILKVDDNRSFKATSINLSLKGGKDKKAEIRGAAFPDELNLRVPVAAVLDGSGIKKEILKIGNFEARLPFNYKRGKLNLKDAVIKAQEVLLKIRGHEFRLEASELMIPYVEIKDSMLKSGNIQLISKQALIYRDGEEFIKDENLFLEGALKGDLEKRWLKLSDLTMETKSLEEIHGDMSIEINRPLTLKADLNYQSDDLDKLWNSYSHPFIQNGIDIQGKGKLHSEFIMTLPENGKTKVNGVADLNIKNGAFSSPDGSLIGEGIDMDWKGSFDFSLPFATAGFSIYTEATGFELLLERFYGDFKDKKIKVSLEGKYDRDEDSLKFSVSELSITDIGAVLVSGEVFNLTKSPIFNTEIRLHDFSNRNAFDFFIRETFKESFPFLSEIEVDGDASMVLLVNGEADRFNVTGDVKVLNIDIVEKDSGLSVTGIHLLLPVNISWPGKSLTEEKERFGHLRIQSISWDDLDIRDIKVFPTLWQNSLTFKEDVSVPIFGGKLRLKEIRYSEILSPERNLTFSMKVDNIDLERLTRSLEIQRFTGYLSGIIPKASLTGNNLVTDGVVIMKIFGGDVSVSNLSVNNIFSPITSIKSSIELKEIDLGRLTDTLEFGHISGIMHGYVKNLVVTNGQAERFDARIETVKRGGISQEISVKALKKITILGSGSSTALLNTGIYRLFKKYRYKKMGFKGSLRNDNFRILGIESEGDRQYLVKGGLLPPKVDVISYTQNVSFQEMVKRFNRIRQMKK